MANLNQALAQAKQSCAQLTEEVETHKAKQWELAQQVEDLQLAAATATSKDSKITPSKAFREREGLSILGTPLRSARTQSNATPSRIFLPAETELDTLRTENKKLKQDLSCLQTNFEFTTRKSSQLRTEMKEAETAMSELQGQLDETLTSKEALQTKYDELLSDVKSKGSAQALAEKKQLQELTQQVETLEAELERVQQQNAELQTQVKSGHDKTQETRSMLDRLDSVKQSLSEEKSLMDCEMETLHGELERLQDKCHDLEDSTSLHQEEKKKSLGTIKALKARVTKLKNEKTELTGQLLKASEKLEQAHDKIQLHVEEVKALKVNLKAKDKENSLLCSQQKDQSRVPVEVEKLRAKLAETTDELNELRTKNDDYQTAKEHLEGKVSELSKQNSKLLRESRHASELALKVNTELERMEERVLSLEGDLEQERETHSATKVKLGDAKKELTVATTSQAECKAEVAKLLDRLSESEQKNFELSTELATCRKQAGVVKETHSDIEQKLMTLEEKLDAAEFALLEKESQISDLNCAYELMEAENSTLLSQVTSLSEMVSTRNFKLEAQHAHHVQHESEYLEIIAKISQLETEHGNCASIVGKLREENESLQASLEKSEVLKREAERAHRGLKSDIKRLEGSISVLKREKASLQDRLAVQDEKHSDMAERCDASESRVHQLERDLKTESLALVAAKNDLTLAKKKQRDIQTELSEKVESLENKLADMDLQQDTLRRDRVELKSRVSDLKAELKEQVLLNSSLKIQRDSLSEQYESLKESALSVLQSDSTLDSTTTAATTVSFRDPENVPVSPKGKGKAKGREMRGALRKSDRRRALNSVENL